MNLSTMEEFKRDLIDVITDYVADHAGEVQCETCGDNKPEEDINGSACPCDFDVFCCEYADCLEERIVKAADIICDGLPNPPISLLEA